MYGYTKLFSSILTSTIWGEPKEVKILWITMLALANKDGMVEGSVPGLAHTAHLNPEETESALKALSTPDLWSRTKEHEGRRIEAVDGGWILLNHGKYRHLMSAEERREYNRVQQQKHRDRRKQASAGVSECQAGQHIPASDTSPNSSSSLRLQEAAATGVEKQTSDPQTQSIGFATCSLEVAKEIYSAYPDKPFTGSSRTKCLTAIQDVVKDRPEGSSVEEMVDFLKASAAAYAAAADKLPADKRRFIVDPVKFFKSGPEERQEFLNSLLADAIPQ